MMRHALVLLFALGCQPDPKDEVADSGATEDDTGSSTSDDSATDDSATDDSATDDSATDDSATDDSGSDDSGEPQASAHRCYILQELGETRLGLVDFDPYTGNHQTVSEFDIPGGDYLGARSLGRVGDVFITTTSGRVVSFDVSTGQSALLRESEAVATANGQSYALYNNQQEGTITLYSDTADITSITPDYALRGRMQGSTLAYADGHFYLAWHSTDRIDVHAEATLELLNTVVLQDYNTWVNGISVVGDMLFLADDGRSELFGDGQYRVYRYDMTTGQQLGVVTVGFYPEGMWCEATGA